MAERFRRSLDSVALLNKMQKQNLVPHSPKQSRCAWNTFSTGLPTTEKHPNRQKTIQRIKIINEKPESLTPSAPCEKRRLNPREILRFARNDKRSGALFGQDVKRVLLENMLEKCELRAQRGAKFLFQRGENPR